ncbi:hypothetical protein ACFO9Q_09415 [Paenibacillus sp. GCM10023252]|uniref:hypothetical protein n=1 Tax=Paenibacillus sp. GCM10023252 TaxID=3252649 RepID=UPI003615DE1B
MNYWCNSYVGGQGQSHHKKDDKHGYLNRLVGKNVKINRGGPESLQGKLLAVESDYLVLSTKEGIVYITTSHVKSITELDNNKSGGFTPDYIVASNFKGVLRALNQKFVQINWGGPEKVEGFLAEVGNDAVLLVVGGKEVAQIQIMHIKTIKVAGKGDNKSGGNKDNNSGNKSGGNKSGGNKSGGNNRTGGSNTGGNRTGGNRTGGNRTGGARTGGNRTGGSRTGGRTGGRNR